MLENIIEHSSPKNIEKLESVFPDIKKLQKCMKVEFEQQTQKNNLRYENYGINESKKQSQLVEKQFCVFQKRVDKMVKNSRMNSLGVLLPMKIQGQFMMIRESVTA